MIPGPVALVVTYRCPSCSHSSHEAVATYRGVPTELKIRRPACPAYHGGTGFIMRATVTVGEVPVAGD